MKSEIYTDLYDSPIGTLIIGSFEEQICLCNWTSSNSDVTVYLRRHLGAEYNFRTSDINKLAIKQLEDYFNKERTKFELPLLICGTEFQKSVLSETCKIQYGEVKSYSQIAINIKSPKAVRAVASAERNNPIAIIIPCHRVLSISNKLTGYAGGLNIKEKLLKLENYNNYKK